MSKEYTNQLSVYLIKKEAEEDKIIDRTEETQQEDIPEIGNIYYDLSHINEPRWIKKFFSGAFNNNQDTIENRGNKLKMFSASTRAALVVEVDERFFVISFGYGHHLIRKGLIEERFGLKTVVNTINPDKLRRIDKVNISNVPKHANEQMAKTVSPSEFGIDVEQDLVQGITGEVKEDLISIFGKTITGKDALSASAKINISGIKSFLSSCYARYRSKDYKEHYSWIDNVYPVNDKNVKEQLDNTLIENIKNSSNKVWMAVPEIIEWEKISHFKYKKNEFSFADINLEEYRDFISDQIDSISTKILTRHLIEGVTEEGDTEVEWTALQCLYCEVTFGEDMYILINGKWYRINSNFSKEINEEFSSIETESESIKLMNCRKDEKENEYNDRVGEERGDIFTMDRKLIFHGGLNQKIEFCDLLTLDKKIIHIKRYGASSVLSHLFAQGLVSGTLFLQDQKFREKLNEKLPEKFKLGDVSKNPDPRDYHVVYAIISNHPGRLDIPFFSKVNLKNQLRTLKGYGYNVSLVKIDVEGA